MKQNSGVKAGLAAMVIAAFLTATTAACIFEAHRLDPNFSSWAASFIRVLANGVIGLLLWARAKPRVRLWGDRSRSLWLWGGCGAITVVTYYACIALIGAGKATFLQSMSGVFIVALGPWLLNTRNTLAAWIAVTGAVFGLAVMQVTELSGNLSMAGTGLGMISALAAAVAYLMMAKTNPCNGPVTLMFYWFLVCLVAHGGAFLLLPVAWPRTHWAWFWLGFGGAQAGAAQFFTSVAFQKAPASSVAALSYLTPVIALGIDVVVFSAHPSLNECVGGLFIILFGVGLPFLKKSAPHFRSVPALVRSPGETY